MSKFASQSPTLSTVDHVISYDGVTTNHEGVYSAARTAKSDLFLLGVVNFVSEDTFYEKGEDRDTRYVGLVHAVTQEDPEWVAKFVDYLRNVANMRSVSIVTACEYVKAGGPNGRAVIASACQRADEPGEVLAYWKNRYGKSLPAAVKRGVADAARRLYNERSFIKYDSKSRVWRFGDVIQLTHAKPVDARQESLFKLALDSRYGNDDAFYHEALPMVGQYRTLTKMDKDLARERLLSDPEAIRGAGMTWESLSSFGPMDKEAWEAIIPNMGYMALLRNLRNFDQAGVSDEVAATVATRLSDPDQVARSRQLPFRFFSAYKNAPSLRWGYALERALDLSLKNVPALTGKTLVLVDTSGSMQGSWSANSTASPLELAALFGSALAKTGQGVDLQMFGTSVKPHSFPEGGSTLSTMKSLIDRCGEVGIGTNIPGAISAWNGHDRIVLISDMQTTHYVSRSKVPDGIPVYAFNLGGYGAAPTTANTGKGLFEFGGLGDSTFQMINSIEQGRKSLWPWDNK